ncbi:mushroom body large-type Kenyon cell-specific protein 1 isoform X2 [Toxorhynchites rutilus septentrionalis]|uniref:mushroom body large-type Kenyon cell-specific protein 1 isoform X2 n=1 Tax=Toxorhynchites rutilus septentrionalis TaxID=329112 RepID=UPI00247A67D3|nr:mushroom body large-type Kenyon cell-specific protein 1 isoform X2 [Toxorhynchites rutilus septentrionalis]XP_055643145.1 mushroom body large-type Kenyon cell-specific protein 1 isoform X2 [Toxorhynchites rutilus septentrionalis]XP_055643156.1 mushroom body large-type Kenyon cell-specific protein 1 isoform X2 [Toxorhynchites rutilus septentrionalis]XP_055643161.1 mushroom body large-type Kenyon cell-specific protein 1 isoform X2 [Toxorhynchites rutilus septentrionalis]XP_055643169.1 mushroom
MADCSYARCVQERRYIRRELAKWTKTMVHIVGLERVAEELMGRRKWKHYQDVLTRQQLNLLDTSTNAAVDDDDLLNSAAAAVASSVASNAVPLTPALVAAVGGNLLDQKATAAATIVRNGHYQQDGELESKLATSNNQQVAVSAAAATADKQQPDHHPEAAAATKQKHFNENDTRPTTASPPPPPQPSTANPTATVGTAVTLLNNSNSHHHQHLHHHHHSHHLHQQQQLVSTKKETPDNTGPELELEQEVGEDAAATREEDLLLGATSDKTANSVSSPALSSSSTATTTTTTLLLSPSAELDERKDERIAVGRIAIKQEPTENQNNSPATPEQSKLIRQENCNNLLNSKIIINNNNSSSANNNNNNNNNNISSGSAPDGEDDSKSHQHQGQPPTPVDWKPQDKCYFCVDGKLLTVNEAGELVPESGGPNLVPRAEVDLRQRVLNDSDSDSSDSSEPDYRAVVGRPASASTKSLAALLRGTGSVPQTMTSLQSMAAQFAAVASLQGIQPSLAQLYNPLWYSQLQQQITPSGSTEPTAAAGTSPTEKGEEVVLGPGGEQPLDLSAKPGTSGLSPGLMFNMMDPKNIYKAKPRLSPISGRRTYTEDELQSALQDILKGKLGTRRAAVQYGIPRSTLRNKVYKLAMEHKRELMHNMSLAALVDDDDDKDSIEDDGKEDSYQMKLNQQAIAEAYLRMYSGTSSTPKHESTSAASTPPQQQPTPEPPLLKPIQSQTQTPQMTAPPQSSPLAAAASSLIDPNLLLQLQSLLLAGGIPGLTSSAAQTKSPEEAANAQAALAALPDLLKKVIQQQELIAEQIKKATGSEPRPSTSTPNLNNGQPFDPRLLPYLQAQQQQNKPRTASGTPETTSSMDLNDGGSDDSQVILKIPSYKPVPGSAPIPPTAAALLAASKNGDHHNLSTPSPPTGAPSVRDLSSLGLGGPGPSANVSSSRPVHTASPQQQQQAPVQPPNHLSVISSPIGIRPRSNSQSPPNILGGKSVLSINDVIARSISKNFQQHHQSDLLKQQMESMEHYNKRPTISVIKNLGGTDISRFGSNPNITQLTAAQLANTGTGGKGTRPKRGKYRNYDRDSLVEAVKAVQRGEMSVHRAGSYYGVPHSTLEYKVKERHLMRPRKREPKPQPGLDGLKSDLGGGSSVMRNMDKSKNVGLGPGSKAQQLKNQYPGTSPNGGLKMPMFDPTMASQLPYTSPFLWPHPAASFSGLPMDFARQSVAGAGAGSSTGSPGDAIFASPMMQRFQDQQQGGKVSAMGSGSGSGSSSGGLGAPKSARELAESIYDGTSTNGSLLDDIIRHSLDKKPGDMPHGALFDQLMKTNNLRTSSGGLDDPSAALLAKVGTKRSATSPLNFLQENIKRERASPSASSTSSTGSSKPPSLPVGLGSISFNDHHHQQQQHQHHQQQQQQQQQKQQLHLHQQQQQQQRHLNTSTENMMLESHRAELLAKGNLAVENLIKLREDLTSMSVAHHQKRTPMEDQHNGAGPSEGQLGKDDPLSDQQQQQHQLLSHRLVSKLPIDDSS